jgi:alpha-beta hydrolase superfamily lysophospholipase
MTITRTPLYFGRDGRSLFGWIHTPEQYGDLAVVVCAPFGHEYVNSHRTVRHLTDALAESGAPAMRFDYDGTGDSAGEDGDPGRVAAWLASIRDAMQALRDATGCPRIALAGIRLGATLAAKIAEETEVAALVLWGPYARGKQYLRELKALQLVGGGGGAETFEPGGFLITGETQSDIAALTIESHGFTLPTTPEMFAPPHAAEVPREAIAEIVRYIGGYCGVRRPQPPLSVEKRQLRLPHSRESIAWFGDVFAIVSEPLHETNAPTVLLPNAGATHHAGPNRLYVFLARALSKAGFRTVRFDLPGLGDSVMEDVDQENDAYLPATTSVIGAVIEPEKPVIVAGLCSGAHAAFHAALDLPDAPIVESVLINPLTFYYKRGMSLDQPLKNFDQWQWYMRSMRRRDRWAKLLRGEVRVGDVARVAMRRLRAGMSSESGDLGRDLRRIADAGRKLTFVFARFDPGYDLLMHGAAATVRQLRSQECLALWRIDDADHTFEAKRSRDAMIESLVRHLSERYVQAR